MIGSDVRTEGPQYIVARKCTNAQVSASLCRIRSMDRGVMKRDYKEEGWLVCSVRTKLVSHVEVLLIEDVVFATRLLHATHAVVPTASLL